jgi:hypothetical protein
MCVCVCVCVVGAVCVYLCVCVRACVPVRMLYDSVNLHIKWFCESAHVIFVYVLCIGCFYFVHAKRLELYLG